MAVDPVFGVCPGTAFLSELTHGRKMRVLSGADTTCVLSCNYLEGEDSYIKVSGRHNSDYSSSYLHAF